MAAQKLFGEVGSDRASDGHPSRVRKKLGSEFQGIMCSFRVYMGKHTDRLRTKNPTEIAPGSCSGPGRAMCFTEPVSGRRKALLLADEQGIDGGVQLAPALQKVQLEQEDIAEKDPAQGGDQRARRGS